MEAIGGAWARLSVMGDGGDVGWVMGDENHDC